MGTSAANQGQLFATLYKELRRLARRELRSNSAATLSPTTLLHEIFLSIARRESLEFGSGAQFLSYASRAMRGLLIDYVRSRQALKRGGDLQFLPLQTDLLNTVARGSWARVSSFPPPKDLRITPLQRYSEIAGWKRHRTLISCGTRHTLLRHVHDHILPAELNAPHAFRCACADQL